MSFYKKIKRLSDVVFSFFLIIILLPILITILIIVSLDLRGWPFFCQKRAGLHGKKFNVIKRILTLWSKVLNYSTILTLNNPHNFLRI